MTLGLSEAPGIGRVLIENKFSVPNHQGDYSWIQDEVKEILEDVIEALNGKNTAYFIGLMVFLGNENSVPVSEEFHSQSVREGVVHVFDLEGHPTATRAYAWSSPIEGSDKRRFFAVLHVPPITYARDAVRAAIVAEHRRKS